jgi:hypothetical protein
VSVSLWIAATVVALAQFLRLKERRLLPLLALFLFLALAHSREWWDPWQRVFEFTAAAFGLLQLFVVPPRRSQPEKP